MNRRNQLFSFALIFLILILFSTAQAVQTKVDNAKVIGTWRIAVSAEGEYYYLTLEMKETEGKLDGSVSESMERLKDAPLSEVRFDGDNLSFEFGSPTPPDGLERRVKAEFKVGADKMEGTLSAPEIGISASATGTRETK